MTVLYDQYDLKFCTRFSVVAKVLSPLNARGGWVVNFGKDFNAHTLLSLYKLVYLYGFKFQTKKFQISV